MTYNTSGAVDCATLAYGGVRCLDIVRLTSFFPMESALRSRQWPEDIRHRIEMSFEPRSSSSRPLGSATTSSPPALIRPGKSSASGASVSLRNASRVWRSCHAAAARPPFPPSVVVAVKALACELPHEHKLPLSRLFVPDIQREAVRRGIVASIGETTIWRWLAEDAIRPWKHRSWIFPRDPNFEQKAGPILDLYAGRWEGRRLEPADCVLSTDEKTSIQARHRIHKTVPAASGQAARVEHEYERLGAWAYFAAWDVRQAKIFGRCERKTGIAPFQRLVADVMSQEPYRSAPRVFWIMDNGSSHAGERCVTRLQALWPNVIPVHTPVHASWLNQIEVYFSILERKVLRPNDSPSLADLENQILRFQDYYQIAAKPFEWKFTRRDLRALLVRVRTHEQNLADAA